MNERIWDMAHRDGCEAAFVHPTYTCRERAIGLKCGFPVCLLLVLPIPLIACTEDDPSNNAESATGGNASQSGAGGTVNAGSNGVGNIDNSNNVGGIQGQPVTDALAGGAGGEVDASVDASTAIEEASVVPDDATVKIEDASEGGASGSVSTIPVDASEINGESQGLSETQTLIPHQSWNCGMPEGIPPPKSGELVFDAEITIGEIHDLGQTQYGHRHQTDITGGSLSGPGINAQFLAGGLDYQLTLSNGALEIEQINVLQTNDGALIYVRNCGASPDSVSEVRVVPDFEAPNGSAYEWLNSGKIVGTRTLDMAQQRLTMSFYDVSTSVPSDDIVEIQKPAGGLDQLWECKTASGIRGAEVYSETVNLGPSLLLGASKRGTRNIIPIIGGTVTGRITGTVLSGGADYQILSPNFEFDARYTIQTDDGELIIVRNCGTFGALAPVFETRIDGKYAWINANNWLSSDPRLGLGVVDLTIYESY